MKSSPAVSNRAKKLFEVLVRESEGALIVYLRTMVRDPGLAEDLFQETLLTAWQKFDDFDQSKPLGPWLRGIALNLARNAGRKRQRDCLVFSDRMAEAVSDKIEAIDQCAGDSWREKANALDLCLEKLPPSSRELIRLRYESQANAQQIATARKSTSTAVRKQLQRIREWLAACLEENLLPLAAEENV